jgi:hypothetical protein
MGKILVTRKWEILNVGNNNEEAKYGISNEHKLMWWLQIRFIICRLCV